MPDAPRYEILDKIASGDFAVVYRARDHELGREVAIKQIHQQFLTDERQLARYWKEAQLLASLQHPNILTIYDIVRAKGWLIVELMRGSLQPATESDGIDLDFLRIAMTGCLSALDFLHANGITHGDIKPSNMLVDAQGRVKLGDFGLARRASNDAGSLLKGTTKYMAPELVSDQFGPVGPASDLYSLGFSAYELMCGRQFETLFPGLGSYGRDKQIAWMMWHAAADRNLPPINRVLEGVPDDLARVIQHLVVKDQSRRCQSAKEALWELRADQRLTSPSASSVEDAAAEAASEAAAKRKRRLRYVAIVSLACSAILCVALLLPGRPSAPPPKPPAPTRGVVTNVYADDWFLTITRTEDGSPQEIRLKSHDRIFINDKPSLLRDLLPHDQVVVRVVVEQQEGKAAGPRITEIRASRPEIVRGLVKEVKPDEARFVVTVEEGEKSKDLTVAVPKDLAITLNGQAKIADKPVALADLRAGDRVVVHHLGKNDVREATELSAQRIVSKEGRIVELKPDAASKELTLTLNIGTNAKPQLLTLPFAPNCEITLNDRRVLNEKLLRPSDLRPGDRATVSHDNRVVGVRAYRVLGQGGTIERVQYAAKTIDVKPDAEGAQPITYIIGSKCKITLGGEPAALDDLRDGDLVDVAHDMPGVQSPEAISVAARRPADPTRWAIVVGCQDFEDRSLGRLEYAVADAKLVREAMTRRYRVPDDQAIIFADESLVRLEQGIPEVLKRIDAKGKLVVYIAGHAYRSPEGVVFFAPKNFDFRRMANAGLPLQWLVDQLESCKAKEKLLLLDCSHAGAGADAAVEPSTAEMLRSLKAPPGRAPLRTVTAVASCRAGQRGADWPDKKHGLFAWLLSEGYAGAADKNRDARIEPTELFGYLQTAMAPAAQKLGVAQAPELFLPDNRPARLSEDAKAAIRKLAAYLRQDHINMKDVDRDYDAALQAAGDEVEPKLLYGLLLLKDKQRDAALRHFDEIQIQHPKLLLPMEAIAWVRFDRRAYQSGIEGLTDLISKTPQPAKPGEAYPDDIKQMFSWVGQLREFAAVSAEDARRPTAGALASLDAAVARHGADAQRSYEEGRAKSRGLDADFERRIAGSISDADAAKLKVERRRIVFYTNFPFDEAAREVLAGMDL